jgi:hypothetical protein
VDPPTLYAGLLLENKAKAGVQKTSSGGRAGRKRQRVKIFVGVFVSAPTSVQPLGVDVARVSLSFVPILIMQWKRHECWAEDAASPLVPHYRDGVCLSRRVACVEPDVWPG